LGTTLFYRTTRKLVLTSEGRQFYTHIADMIRSAESGLNELNALSEKPVGDLKMTLPAFMETSAVSSAIADFVKHYPEVNLSLSYTDQVVDMLSEGLDLRIRAGVDGIEDSSMMSRKLGKIKRLVVANKQYLTERPYPKHPSELKSWDWIRFEMRPGVIEFISPDHETVSIPENSRISVNSANALKYYVRQGIGISILPENLIENELNSGELIHMLPEWEVKSLECYAIWPDKSRRENLTMLLVRHLVEYSQR
jgi:DNA-binding transcriptional LysR family regulator